MSKTFFFAQIADVAAPDQYSVTSYSLSSLMSTRSPNHLRWASTLSRKNNMREKKIDPGFRCYFWRTSLLPHDHDHDVDVLPVPVLGHYVSSNLMHLSHSSLLTLTYPCPIIASCLRCHSFMRCLLRVYRDHRRDVMGARAVHKVWEKARRAISPSQCSPLFCEITACESYDA